MNLEVILRDFNNHRQALNLSEGTRIWQTVLLTKFFAFLEQEEIWNLNDVDGKVMLRYQIHLSQLKNKKNKAYHPSVQNLGISAVRKLFKYLRRKGEVEDDPTVDMEASKTPHHLPRSILSVEEMKRLLAQPDERKPLGLRDRALLEVLYSTGVRQAEVLHLDINDLNPDGGTIFIRDGKGSRDRVVPCGRIAWECLEKYIRDSRPSQIKDSMDQAVFISREGSRLGKQGLLTMVKRHGKMSGIIRSISPHTIRASVATHLADNGCGIRFIQELLGHASINTTQLYISVSIRQLKEVHRRFHPRE
jgi:integrase/recombinase XerD